MSNTKQLLSDYVQYRMSLSGLLQKPAERTLASTVVRRMGIETERLCPNVFLLNFLRFWRGLQGLENVCGELLSQGICWGRIVQVISLTGFTCAKYAERGMPTEGMVEKVSFVLEKSASSWIEDAGGWDAFVEIYNKYCPPDNCTPSCTVVVGMLVLMFAIVAVLFSIDERVVFV